MLAYLISAHTDAPQLARLIRALHDDAHFFVHIDRKSDIGQFVSLIDDERVHFLEQRVDVRWGTILEVEYQMRLVKAALDWPLAFDRLIFLSGMDYPLWSNDRITSWLQEQGDREILCGIRMDTDLINSKQHEQYAVRRPFFDFKALGNKGNQRLSILCRRVMKVLGIRKSLSFEVGNIEGLPPLTADGRMSLYKGSAWWCISEGLATYIYKVYTEVPEVRRYFVDSFGQAETVAQTIAFNSPVWASRCMLVEGEYPGLAALTPLHFIVYEPVIKVMEASDYDMLMASGRMFTRKLQSGKSDELVERIKNKNLKPLTPCP